MKRALIAMAMAALLLAGCATTAPRIVVPDLAEVPRPKMPPDVRAECDPLPPPPKKPATMGGLLEYADAVVSQWAECATRNKAKADWAKSQGL